MGGVGVIDRFLQVFTSYIDSGFGLRPDKEGFGQQAVRTILEDLSWERGR